MSADPIETRGAEVVQDILEAAEITVSDTIRGAMGLAYIIGHTHGARSVVWDTGSIDIRTLQATRQ